MTATSTAAKPRPDQHQRCSALSPDEILWLLRVALGMVFVVGGTKLVAPSLFGVAGPGALARSYVDPSTGWIAPIFVQFITEGFGLDVAAFLQIQGVLEILLGLAMLFVPAFAFFTLYSFNVIMFAMIYRIIDRFSRTPQFFIDGERQTISFIDSLYYSMITVSTVGYGDITPATDAIRAVTAVEVMIGILLLLFGFFELIRFSRRAHEQGRD